MVEKWQSALSSVNVSEHIERESLTYWQDSWRRLKRNKSSIFSMIIILIILLSALFVPFVWKFSYEEQDLNFANLPPRLALYHLGDDRYVYITSDFKCIEVTSKGELLQASPTLIDDKEMRRHVFDVYGSQLEVDYSLYFKAKSSFIQLSRKKVSEVRIGEVPYLKEYFGDTRDEDDTVDMIEAESILNDKIERFRVSYQGKIIYPQKKVWNKTYIWGSDSLGRDVFIRVIYGARMSLLVGVVSALVNFIVGILYGGIAGYFGGRTDMIMMRFVDTISSIPMMLYVILIMVVLGSGLTSILIAMGLTYWVGMARIVRSQVMSMREQEFVLAAILTGVSTSKILTRHLIPNAMGPIMVALTMQIPSAMFTEAFLSFIGLGVSAPKASWGAQANAALPGLYTHPYQLFFPAAAMSITILALNLFSDGLRDSLDPKLRK